MQIYALKMFLQINFIFRFTFLTQRSSKIFRKKKFNESFMQSYFKSVSAF